MSDENCATCRFCRRSALPVKGTCLRYPPTVISGPEGSYADSPDVWLSGWCGEYKRKDDKANGDPT